MRTRFSRQPRQEEDVADTEIPRKTTAMTKTGGMPNRNDGNQEKDGQALAEYALILMFIALVCFGAVTLLGGSIRGVYDGFNGSF